MYTVQLLLDIATEAESRYLELSKEYPPGTYNESRNRARRLMDEAIICATWMEKNGHDTLKCVGPFQEGIPCGIPKDYQVEIPKGTLIFSTAPGYPREGRRSSKTVSVKPSAFDNGYIDSRDHEPKVVQGKVTWAGAGGYWRWTDINNVDLKSVYG